MAILCGSEFSVVLVTGPPLGVTNHPLASETQKAAKELTL